MIAKEKIIAKIKYEGCYLALHEFNIKGVSQNSIGSRLPELAKEDKVFGRYRKGENFKEWGLAEWEVKEYKVENTGQFILL